MDGVDLTPSQKRVKTLEDEEAILSRAGSGYGREQVVRYALQVACGCLLALGVYRDGTTEGDLALAFLRASERRLGEATESTEADDARP